MLVTRVYGRHISLIQRQSHWREGGGIENGSVEQGPLGVGVDRDMAGQARRDRVGRREGG